MQKLEFLFPRPQLDRRWLLLPGVGGPLVAVYNPELFHLTTDGLTRLGQITSDPSFRENYPHHQVFVAGNGEIVGAIPERTESGEEYGISLTTLQEEVRRRGITVPMCAIIHTNLINRSV